MVIDPVFMDTVDIQAKLFYQRQWQPSCTVYIAGLYFHNKTTNCIYLSVIHGKIVYHGNLQEFQ